MRIGVRQQGDNKQREKESSEKQETLVSIRHFYTRKNKYFLYSALNSDFIRKFAITSSYIHEVHTRLDNKEKT